MVGLLEENKIYNLDCLEGLQMLPERSVDLIFVDLPYGTTNCRWDIPIDLEILWREFRRVIKEHGAILLFAQTPFDKILGCSNLKWLRYEWIWQKTLPTGHLNANKMPLKAHENILVFYNKLPTYHPQKTSGHTPVNNYTKYIESQNNSEIYKHVKHELSGGGQTERYPRDVIIFPKDVQTSHLHPTQKPLELCRYMIRTYTNESDLVVDCCCGSGTIPLAAKIEGRKFIGMDNGICTNSGYYCGQTWAEIASERITNYFHIEKQT